MTNTLAIEISGQMLQMTLMVPDASGRPLARLAKALLGTQELKKTDAVQLIGVIDASSVGARIGQALEALGKRSAHSLKSCDVRVQLGSDFAKVAIIDSPSNEGKELSASALHQHLQAWAVWNWGASSLGILRHASLDGGRLMVSAINQDMSDALEQYCIDTKLRLVDCRSAVLSMLESPPTQTATMGFDVLVVEEVCEGQPSPLVQFIARNQRAMLSVHRMWLPEAAQESIQGVAQRVLAHHAHSSSQEVTQAGDASEQVVVRRVQWPATAVGGHRG